MRCFVVAALLLFAFVTTDVYAGGRRFVVVPSCGQGQCFVAQRQFVQRPFVQRQFVRRSFVRRQPVFRQRVVRQPVFVGGRRFVGRRRFIGRPVVGGGVVRNLGLIGVFGNDVQRFSAVATGLGF